MREPAQRRYRPECAPGHEQARTGREPGQRRPVQMVGVQVGDEREIGAPGVGRGERAARRRRCASLRANRGSVSTRMFESTTVQVACPHQVISTGTSLPPSRDSPKPTGRSRVGGLSRR
ncbi:hypothetical protein GCM10020295_14040 [Streptomyces cinereospinus]